MPVSLRDRYERHYAPDRKTWRAWLRRNHKTSTGIWLVNYKKASGKPRVPYDEAVEEALCFGWIDSVANPIDDDSYMQLFTPRKAKSGWSKLNQDRVEKLTRAKQMAKAGLDKVEAAKRDGSWSKLDAMERGEVPPDLQQAFAANPTALANFEAFSPSRKKMLLHWISNVKSPEKRAERIASLVARAVENRDARPAVVAAAKRKAAKKATKAIKATKPKS